MCGHHSGVPLYPQRSESVAHPLLPKITNTRIDKFFWGPYASQHLDKTLAKARYSGSPHVKLQLWSAPDDGKPSFHEATAHLGASAKEIGVGHVFGTSWTNHWVKVALDIPQELRSGDEQIIFEFDPSCEGMVYTIDGVPIHGGPNTMKDGSPGEQEDRRVEHIIPSEAVAAGSYTCFIEVTCNGMFGLGPYRYLHPDDDRTFPLVSADIVVPNPHARGLRTDFRILAEIARHPSAQTTGLAQRCLKACDDIMNAFRQTEQQSQVELDRMLSRCRKIGWGILGDLSEEDIRKLAVWNDDADRDADIWAIGHCHIDTAWLWRYTQTQQKIARSWTSQCDLMDRYPGHQFAASSAQQVCKYVKEGRFHPVGGAWLEHDCMMPSGESLCRHYLYGQRYFREKFGSYCREAFLPDTFGYASQLPQILRSAGLQYFFTQKISWNNINVFPYNTFNWAGIDGTQVLAHMTPVDGYNGQCTFTEIIKGIQNNKNLGTTDKALFLFGNGDGGGGPTPAMMERLERLDSLGRNNPGVPTIKVGSPIDFFDDLCRKTSGGATLPTWRGELYLELHRGTYTTQAVIKRGNRDMETLFRDVEYFATMASLRGQYQYPTDEIRECWQEMMLGQFHDCLPGTTIKAVVQDNLEIYERRGSQAKSLLDAALKALEVGVEEGFVIDPMRLAREELYLTTPGRYSWLSTDNRGIGSLAALPSDLSLPVATSDDNVCALNNDRYAITVSTDGITSIYDKMHDREIIAPGIGTESARLMLYEDYPLTYDAWDAEIYHLQMGQALQFDGIRTKDEGVRKSIVATAMFGKSRAEISISLDATTNSTIETAPIHVKAEIDWHEQHRFLKFALPMDIHSAYATYGTQFGVVERPTHRNTMIDQAKFEVCAHGFADLSEAGYGVAIACRDKYGYAVEGNTMRLSLVRASTSPDPEADQGHHDISFAIMPHAKHIADSDIHRQALLYNNRPYVLAKQLEVPSFTLDGADGIVLETIKRGEDDDANGRKTVLCRLYEAKGGRARGRLTIKGVTIKRAEFVNILEEELDGDAKTCKADLRDDGAVVHLDLRCFEVTTLRLTVRTE